MSSCDYEVKAAYYRQDFNRFYWLLDDNLIFYTHCPDILTAYMLLTNLVLHKIEPSPFYKSSYTKTDVFSNLSYIPDRAFGFIQLTLPEIS